MDNSLTPYIAGGEKMKSIKELHEKAMDLAEFAFVAKLRGDLAQAEKLFRQAFKYESQAARLVHKVPSSRLTRAVLYRSAATLALDCKKPREAEQFIAEGLAGNPPLEIEQELKDLYKQINRAVKLLSTEVEKNVRLRDLIKELKDNAARFRQIGYTSSMFGPIYMEQIRKLRAMILEHEDVNACFDSLKPLLEDDNRGLREQGAYLIGELMRLHPDNPKIDSCVSKLNACINEGRLEPINVVGREVVNALGKSGRQEAEKPVLGLLLDRRAHGISNSVLVALGRVGGVDSVQAIFDFMRMPKKPGGRKNKGDKMYTLWALGKLGIVETTSKHGFPLPRTLLKAPLLEILKIARSPIEHPNIHYYATYAIGEICDGRNAGLLQDSPLPASVLKEAETALISLDKRFESDEREQFQKLLTRAKISLRTLRSETLSPEEERILLDDRILLDFA
jgi:hypothetical protein